MSKNNYTPSNDTTKKSQESKGLFHKITHPIETLSEIKPVSAETTGGEITKYALYAVTALLMYTLLPGMFAQFGTMFEAMTGPLTEMFTALGAGGVAPALAGITAVGTLGALTVAATVGPIVGAKAIAGGIVDKLNEGNKAHEQTNSQNLEQQKQQNENKAIHEEIDKEIQEITKNDLKTKIGWEKKKDNFAKALSSGILDSENMSKDLKQACQIAQSNKNDGKDMQQAMSEQLLNEMAKNGALSSSLTKDNFVQKATEYLTGNQEIQQTVAKAGLKEFSPLKNKDLSNMSISNANSVKQTITATNGRPNKDIEI